MIKLDDTGVFVGEIKQFLHDFNLPKCPIVKELDTKREGHYIYNRNIYLLYKKDNIGSSIYQELKCPYILGKKYQNLTTNLKIDNLIYDNHTHRYFGKYLKFLRDYADINLLRLYNCFDYEALTESVNWSVETKIASSTKITKFSIDPNNSNFIYFQVPFNINEKYTLFMDCGMPVETVLTTLQTVDVGKNIDYRNKLNIKTHKFIIPSKATLFNYQYLVTKGQEGYDSDELANFILNNTENLFLIFKIPKNYTNYICLIMEDLTNLPADDWFNSELNSYRNNNKGLLSDRIVEYLTGNVVTPQSKYYDVMKMQKALGRLNLLPEGHVRGYWNDTDLASLKTFIRNRVIGNSVCQNRDIYLYEKKDILGYMDKDVEEQLSSTTNKWGGIV